MGANNFSLHPQEPLSHSATQPLSHTPFFGKFEILHHYQLDNGDMLIGNVYFCSRLLFYLNL
jgi:hypothetical protein